MKIFQVDEILNKLENCIVYRKSFSVIRFGDGGLKFICSLLERDNEELSNIVMKEGLPVDKLVEFFELWGYYARKADFIDCPEVYFDGTFWSRVRSENRKMSKKTQRKLLNWKSIYHSAEFDNDNYCNPELNYLSILRRDGKRNLLDIMRKRKICLITTFPEVRYKLSEYNIDIIKIVGQYERQYDCSFEEVTKRINENSRKYDLWLVAAGEIGRIYSGMIKENGGRSFDLGFVIEFWLGQDIHPRLQLFVERDINNPLELRLTTKGKKYEEYI
jgi:hypothetical protein